MKIDAENPFITKLSPESDIFALGWLINELCGDYFTDMTDEEKREYNRDARDKGLPYSDAADVHAQRLKEALDLMRWEKIRSPYGNQRRKAVWRKNCVYTLNRMVSPPGNRMAVYPGKYWR
ncbi:hypothetical protein R1sor_004282 [Riccia sorocarpa]|uniref:Uncharacterized protein n=1 Tax=Riccia sorocarpa TaxID=122646 RepID=A0ABD3HIA5_9MARC